MTPPVFLMGPTCSGKSDAAVELALALDGEIISLDSMQIYSALPILTAQPTRSQRERVRHHLVDKLTPDEHFDVVSYTRLALRALDDIQSREKTPILAGGTWYYFRALVDGFDPLPPGDDKERKAIVSEFGPSLESLHAELSRIDPLSAARLHKNDRRRVIRAIEVFRLTGRPMSALLTGPGKGPVKKYRAFYLSIDRDLLYTRINERVDRMMEAGALDEVRRLAARWPDEEATIYQALGVRQLLEHLKGRSSFGQAVDKLKADTRRFAKRQLSYFRRDKRIEAVPVSFDADAVPPARTILKLLRHDESYKAVDTPSPRVRD